VTALFAEEPLRGTSGADPAAIERAIRTVLAGESLLVRVPAHVGARAEVDLTYRVRCVVWRGRDVSRLNEVVKVEWYPGGGVPLPKLRASVESDWNDDGTVRVLRLEGGYEPPGGELGHAFDVELGHRIAEASAHDFLRRIAGELSAAKVNDV